MKVIRYPLRKVMAVPNITARVLQTVGFMQLWVL